MLCGCKHGEYAPRCNGTHLLVLANKNTPAAATALFYGYDFASIQDALYGQDIDLTLISQQESEQF